ncbi:MAG: hypothetical protein QM766_16540 [Burkholderiaceae bacterium]
MPAKWLHRFERKPGRWVFEPSPEDATGQILPYGFIQSPLLASLALHKSGLGKFLDELHRDRRFVVTVYVDDIIVSGGDHDELRDVLSGLKTKAQRSRFAFSDEKEQGPAGAISAFNIELTTGTSLSVLPSKLAEFRDAFRTSTSELQRAGIQGYVRSVNRVQADSLP